jgi:Uncharacterized protein conserved in bacteria
MEKVDFLPLGTIVSLKGSVKKSVIIARGLATKLGEDTKYFDYGGVTYPEGLIGDSIQYFNVDSIDEVVFKGFSDADDVRMVKNINSWVEKSPFERGDLFELNQMHAQKAAAERQE